MGRNPAGANLPDQTSAAVRARQGEIRYLRDIFGEGGTDIVDVTAIRDRTIDKSGHFVEGDPRSLAGHRGFVIVYGDDQPRLVGNITIANLTTNSAFGVNAAGFGYVGRGSCSELSLWDSAA